MPHRQTPAVSGGPHATDTRFAWSALPQPSAPVCVVVGLRVPPAWRAACVAAAGLAAASARPSLAGAAGGSAMWEPLIEELLGLLEDAFERVQPRRRFRVAVLVRSCAGAFAHAVYAM